MDFKRLSLEDKPIICEFLKLDPPLASEFTFTNLFMWRCRYKPIWKRINDLLVILLRNDAGEYFGTPPIGMGNKEDALRTIFDDLEKFSVAGYVAKAEKRFIEQWIDPGAYNVSEDIDNSDYVYLSKNLIELPGNRYHKKRNHINKFTRNFEFEYKNLDVNSVDCFLNLQEDWCEMRKCIEDPELLQEDKAIYEALINYEELDFRGGGILIDNKVEAFALGERLNDETAVIHIEKANPEINGLYAAINQLFCANNFTDFKYINREQDLGISGLRQAKQSYYPHHMIEKFVITRKQ